MGKAQASPREIFVSKGALKPLLSSIHHIDKLPNQTTKPFIDETMKKKLFEIKARRNGGDS